MGAIKLIITEGGIEKESDYPYHARMATCQFTKSKKAVSVSGVHTLQTGQESAIQSAVGNVGPVSVAIDAGHTELPALQVGCLCGGRLS